MTRAPDTVSTPKEQGMSQARFEREGPVGSIVLNHPPQNRIGHQMMLDLTDAVAEASASDIRVLLVRGDGPDFCFGGDVREWPDATPHGLRSFTYRVNAAFRAIELLPIPTVAVVQGAAYGGGFELALSCDLILAAESAHFRFVEATIAVPPLAGGVQRLAERIGRSAAARLVLLAQRVSASELADLQVVAKVVADTELDDEAAALAAELASGPTRAHAATKALLQAWATGGLATADRLMPDLVSHLFQTEDVAAGLDAAVTALKTGTKRPMLAFQGK